MSSPKASLEESELLGGTRSHTIPKPLTFLPLVALIFFDVSGGPFGTEDAVNAASPFLALLGFVLLPLVWSLPEALITAELATTFPENSGFVAWVTAAYGPYAGWMEGWFKWLSGVTDNAIYPVIFLKYLEHFAPLKSGAIRLVILYLLNILLSYLNYRGLHVVGTSAIAMTVITLMPFILLCILGIPHVKPSNWLIFEPKQKIDWLTFLNVMFWCLNYWDSASTVAGEVRNPSRTFPKAMKAAVVLVSFSYFLPLLIGLGIDADDNNWTLGYFVTIAQNIGGSWLAWWLIIAAAVSQLGQFEAEMTTDSYQLLGMAERGFLPEIFARRSKYGSPTLAIILSSCGVGFIATFNFVEIVQLLNSVYCLAEILEFLAFLKLRQKYPTLERPFAVPLSISGCIVMLAPALTLLVLMLVMPLFNGNWTVVLFSLAASFLGAILYPLMQYARRHNLLRFYEETPEDFESTLLIGINSSTVER